MTIREYFKRRLVNLFEKVGLIDEINRRITKESTLPKFANNPHNVRIDLPRIIGDANRIYLGNDVTFGPGCWLIPIVEYPGKWIKHPDRRIEDQKFDPKLVIGNRVTATAGLQIFVQQEVVIEDDVMFASNIHINDALHGYMDANEPYKYQPLTRIAPIVIKKGCWVGQNVVILPGVTIGEYSIIGANSVVTKGIPPRSIAAGVPARIIRMWDDSSKTWTDVRK